MDAALVTGSQIIISAQDPDHAEDLPAFFIKRFHLMIKLQALSILMPDTFIHHGEQLRDVFDDIHLLSAPADLEGQVQLAVKQRHIHLEDHVQPDGLRMIRRKMQVETAARRLLQPVMRIAHGLTLHQPFDVHRRVHAHLRIPFLFPPEMIRELIFPFGQIPAQRDDVAAGIMRPMKRTGTVVRKDLSMR